MSTIDKDFRTTREELNLSQQDVAILLSVSRVTYNKWEQEPDTMPIGKYEELKQHLARLSKLREE